MDIEFIEKDRSTQSMDNHRDLTVFIEGSFQEFFDMLIDMEIFIGQLLVNERTYLGIGDHINITQTIDVSIGRTKAT
jgi:hypothetical protein